MTPLLPQLYKEYTHLTFLQKRRILKELHAKGYEITKIRAVQYTPDSEVGTHFFFYTKNEEPKRYWEIPEEMWKCFVSALWKNQREGLLERINNKQ